MGGPSATASLVTAQILKWYAELRPGSLPARPLVIGISGPQGAGKTTLVRNISAGLSSAPHSLNVVAFSLDDLYLPFEKQTQVAASNPGNKLVELRGNPGTHDVALGRRTLETLRQNGTTPIPSYNKAANDGKGDQNPPSTWTTVQPPFHIILFEGWSMGFKSLAETELEAAYKALSKDPDSETRKHSFEHIKLLNEGARVWEREWYPMFDTFVHICCKDIHWVYDWRIEAENTMRKELNKPDAGMSDSELIDFVSRFMPFYELGLPRLTKVGFFGSASGDIPEEYKSRHLRASIDKQRNLLFSDII
ncbi:hypothetical protein SmJEL517_g00240 [Synchytrium microbalum]|uniref:Phosphoribulokinase/uridine kinase domain-containing protein n=1 Tax=Synchytrium microbalum TaxID=1806994 RepID=A0A507CG61_9FUNG|nr:uncharacterized protein SmJEL517_g00240 [Synchytrium microbalum]TPX38179.1 hypothetical protein SmJEL517_g00240 [Synchytrium microbalum]